MTILSNVVRNMQRIERDSVNYFMNDVRQAENTASRVVNNVERVSEQAFNGVSNIGRIISNDASSVGRSIASESTRVGGFFNDTLHLADDAVRTTDRVISNPVIIVGAVLLGLYLIK